MRLSHLANRSLWHYRRTNLGVVLGVIAGASALTGALLVGDSMRGSLREAALKRLGGVDSAIVSNGFFRVRLAADLRDAPDLAAARFEPAPIILTRGAAEHAASQARMNRIQIIGADSRFWRQGGMPDPLIEHQEDRSVVINQALADGLVSKVGDEVLLRIPRASGISSDMLMGRRDDATISMRLTVREILPDEGIAGFSISPSQAATPNAFVWLVRLQEALEQQGRANALLCMESKTETGGGHAQRVERALRERYRLDDLGLTVRRDAKHHYVALESRSFLIDPRVEAAAMASAREMGVSPVRILTHLANSIAMVDPDATSRPGDAAIPYSTIAAIDPPPASDHPIAPAGDAARLQPGEILLNDWAAEDLQARAGDRVEIEYYVSDASGRLLTRRAAFTMLGITPLAGGADDPGFTPIYRGITDSERLADWSPPFPVDLKRVRPKDEDYWRQYRTTPKAFITLADGQRLWGEQGDRWGRLTSIRLYAPEPAQVESLARQFESDLRHRLNPADAGLTVEPLRDRALAGSAGTTDFGMLFIGFSFFLVASSAMLVALLLRLGVERRAGEIGMMLATGFTPVRVRRLLLLEGGAMAAIGSAVGLAGAAGYAWLMLAGLRTWWSAAVNAPFLRLHVSPTSLAIGFVASFLIAIGAIAWTVRGLSRQSPRALLAGATSTGGAAPTRRRWVISCVVAVTLALLAGVLLIVSAAFHVVPETGAFFGGGALLLIAALVFASGLLHRPTRGLVRPNGLRGLVTLGVRNAPRHAGRSLMTVALIASATFVIASMEAFRLEPAADAHDRASGTGGFDLLAESTVSLPHDPATDEGRRKLGLVDDVAGALNKGEIVSFRVQPGDETSCLSLYQASRPRILGATPAMIERGGFRFAASLAESDAERANPWRLLERPLPDGVVPVIGDEAAVKWQLHSGLGKELVIRDERGRDVRLRFVALLQGSILQSELIVAENQFTRLFPGAGGYGFFLITSSPDGSATLAGGLERGLSRYGFDATPSSERLRQYLAVQNTYLSTFQALGGFGLVLGALGLVAVLLRNVWERRAELALLRALGYSRGELGVLVLAENAALVLGGLLAGWLPAMVAVGPQIAQRGATLPWASLALTLAGVIVVGLGAGALALRPTLRAPLVPALRRE